MLTQWKALERSGVPDFYLVTLERRPREDAPRSLAGFQLSQPFTRTSLDRPHTVASKDYFAPRGMGTFRCSLCSRYFLEQSLLDSHNKSTAHLYALAKSRGEVTAAVAPEVPPVNVNDCGEFDQEFYQIPAEPVLEGKDALLPVDVNREGHRGPAWVRRLQERQTFYSMAKNFEGEKGETVVPDYAHVSKKNLELGLVQDIERAEDLGNELTVLRLKKKLHRMRNDGRGGDVGGGIVQGGDGLGGGGGGGGGGDGGGDDAGQDLGGTETDSRQSMTKRLVGGGIDPDDFVDERDSYLSVCSELGIAPKPTVITMKKDGVFSIPSHGVGDKNMAAIAAGLKMMNDVNILDLSDNRLSTSKNGTLHSLNRVWLSLSGRRPWFEISRILEKWHLKVFVIQKQATDRFVWRQCKF